MENEIYSLDFSSNLLIYAGNDLKCTVYDTINNSIFTIIEGFTDSVIYCKFINNNLVLVCTIDGNILITILDGSFSYTEYINEEISCVEVSEEYIFIGTYIGSIYKFKIINNNINNINNNNNNINNNNMNNNNNINNNNINNNNMNNNNNNNYKLELEEVLTLQGTEILKIIFNNNIIYSLSETCLVSSNNLRINIENGTSFSKIPNTEILCICSGENILIYKSNLLINKFKIEGYTELVEYTNDYFIVAGYCDYLLLINTRNNWSTHKMIINSSGINKLKIKNKYEIYFSTMCGFVGVFDIRDDKSLMMYESNIEIPFDLFYESDVFYVGGLKGLDILKVEDFSKI